jgi:cephalosporin-C deacetylase
MNNNSARHFLIAFAAVISIQFYVAAQPIEQRVKVVVAPDKTDWTYKPGEKVKFNITVLRDGNSLKNVPVKYEYGPEKMEPLKTPRFSPAVPSHLMQAQ